MIPNKRLYCITAHVEKEDHAAFHALAERRGLSAAALLRMLIEDALVQNEYRCCDSSR